MSVNLSRRQLISPHLADEVRTALSLSGIDPHQLMLEITESVLMENPERAAQALAELRSLGIRIAVDDFGTGYSSLSHLQRFPVDVLKIDKSFIDPLVRRDPGSSALVTAIIGLARSLGLEVIAEGIEHESQLHRLVELGCLQGQGFLMARPLDGRSAPRPSSPTTRSGKRRGGPLSRPCHSALLHSGGGLLTGSPRETTMTAHLDDHCRPSSPRPSCWPTTPSSSP